jgi:nitrate/nitrite-specific signal transduction histidine kinase
MFYNFLIKFCLVSVLILISACSSQSLNSDSSINNQADSLELESYELEISQLMQSYEEAEESDSDSLDSYFHEENSTANSEVKDNVIDNDVESIASALSFDPSKKILPLPKLLLYDGPLINDTLFPNPLKSVQVVPDPG